MFTGATADLPGVPGLVPAPQAGVTNKFLRSDGKWATVDSNGGTNVAIENILTIVNVDKLLHEVLIEQTTANLTLVKGDIIIIKDIISEDIYQHTAYVYNGIKWQAFDGNYNAKNIYLNKDFIFTDSIGAIKVPEGQTVTINTDGKNLEEFIQLLTNKDKIPTIIEPTVQVLFETIKEQEVGTTVVPKYSISFEDGYYTYGTATTSPDITGVKILSCQITDGIESFDGLEGTFNELIVKDNINWHITATINYSDGLIPLTLLGKEYPEGQIKANSASFESSVLTSYRSFFYGMTDIVGEINSTLIRSLENGGKYNDKKILTLIASKPCTRSIIAIPENNNRGGLVSAILKSSLNIPITSEYKKLENTVLVEGVNGYTAIPYNVWVYEPGAGIGADEIHEIVLE